MQLACVDPANVPDWDVRLAGFAGATVFHSRAWSLVLSETYGFRPFYLTTSSGPQLTGLLPLMEASSWITGRRGISLPFTDHCHPLDMGTDELDALYSEARSVSEQRRWRYLELRGGTRHLGAPASVSYFRHDLDLTLGAPALFARCDSATRRAVRKAEREGVSIETSGSPQAMAEFHQLFCRTRQRHGAPPPPPRFFERIRHHVIDAGLGSLFIARHSGRAIAAALFFHLGRNAMMKFSVSDERLQALRGNNLVLWRAIASLATAGFESLDFGRTSLENAGLRHFKLSWGAREEILSYVRFNPRTHSYQTVRDAASGWQSRLFRLLPSPVTRLIGAAVYPHIA